jgi:Oxidoreductase family, NAD-binding Rossmann fold
MNPVRFGLIGCSSIARRRFAPALRAAPSARIERIGSRDLPKAEQFAREFGCAKSGSYEDVIADPRRPRCMNPGRALPRNMASISFVKSPPSRTSVRLQSLPNYAAAPVCA